MLERKQAYYEYGDGYTYKEPPRLDPSLEREMLKFGTDEHGDPLWRFLWAGVAVTKKSPDDPGGTVRGDRGGACHRNGVLTCRYLHVKAKAFVAHCFRNRKGKGKVVRVKRKEWVPAGALSWEEWEYTHFGKLRWYLERKLSAAQLVQSGLWRGTETDIPLAGDYVCLIDPPLGKPIETHDRLYYKPDRAYLEAISKHLHEERTESLSDLLLRHRERTEKQETAERKEGAVAVMDMVENALSESPYRRAKTLLRGRRPPLFTGDIQTV
jgi:hypothetical protein